MLGYLVFRWEGGFEYDHGKIERSRLIARKIVLADFERIYLITSTVGCGLVTATRVRDCGNGTGFLDLLKWELVQVVVAVDGRAVRLISVTI